MYRLLLILLMSFTFTQDEEEIPITNAQFLANSYANSSLKHF